MIHCDPRWLEYCPIHVMKSYVYFLCSIYIPSACAYVQCDCWRDNIVSNNLSRHCACGIYTVHARSKIFENVQRNSSFDYNLEIDFSNWALAGQRFFLQRRLETKVVILFTIFFFISISIQCEVQNCMLSTN